MCDELTARDAEEFLKKTSLTRRDFSKRTAGAALAMMLPPVANALDVTESDVMVETPDGTADCYFVHPSSGKHAAVHRLAGYRQYSPGISGNGQTSCGIGLFGAGRKPLLPHGAWGNRS